MGEFDKNDPALKSIIRSLVEIRAEIVVLRKNAVSQKQLAALQERLTGIETHLDLKPPEPLVESEPVPEPVPEPIVEPESAPEPIPGPIVEPEPTPEPIPEPSEDAEIPLGIPVEQPEPETWLEPGIKPPSEEPVEEVEQEERPVAAPHPEQPTAAMAVETKPPPVEKPVEQKPLYDIKVPEPPPPKKMDWGDIESLAAVWGTRIGAFIVVLGLGYLLSIGFSKLGPFGKTLCVYAAFISMWVTGVVFERLERYSSWAKIMVAGGWAGIYVTTFLIHYLPEARLIPDPAMDVFLLMAIAAGMILHSLKYKTESLTTLCYFIAFITISLSINLAEQTFFPLLASGVLAVSMLFILRYLGWTWLALFSVVACYGTHAIWVNPLIDSLWGDARAGTEYTSGLVMLILYWCTFTTAAFLVQPKDENTRKKILWLVAVNFFSFTAVFRYHVGDYHPEWRWYFTGTMAIAYGVQAVAAHALKRDRLYMLNLVIALLCTTLTLYFRIPGNWLTVAWLLQAEALYAVGLLADEGRYRKIAIWNFVLVVAWMGMHDYFSNAEVTILGLTMLKRTLVFSTVAVAFYANSIARSALGTKIKHKHSHAEAFSYIASVIVVILLVRNWYPGEMLNAAVFAAVLGPVLLEIGIRNRDESFWVQGLFFSAMSIAAALMPMLASQTLYYENSLAFRLSCLGVVIALAYYVFWRSHRMTEKDGAISSAGVVSWIAVAAAVTATLTLGLLLWREFSIAKPFFVAVSWMVLAATLVEMGIVVRSRAFHWLGLTLAGLAFVWALFNNLGIGGSVGPFGERLVTLSVCIALLYYMFERMRIGAKRGATWIELPEAGIALSWLAGFLLILLIHREIWIRWPAWVGVAWLVPMVLFVIISFRRNDHQFLYQALAVSAAVFFWTLFVAILAEVKDESIELALQTQRLYSVPIVIASFYAIFGLVFAKGGTIFDEEKKKIAGYIGDAFSFAATILLVSLCTNELDPVSKALTTGVWIGIGVGLFEIGKFIRSEALKGEGLLLVIATVCRFQLVDINAQHGEFIGLSGRLCSGIVLAAVLIYLFFRLRDSEENTPARVPESAVGIAMSYLATVLIGLLILVEVNPSQWIPALWAVLALVAIAGGIALKERHLILQSLVLVAPIAGGLIIWNIAHPGSTETRVAASGAIGILFVARILWQVGMARVPGLLGKPGESSLALAGPAMHVYSMSAAALLIIFLSVELSGGLAKYMTIAWAGEGLLLMVLGFALQDRLLRFAGLGVLGVSVIKVFFDLWVLKIDRIYKVIALVGLGAILILTGWLYSRFREQIKRLFVE
jgi:uncharacterized membrane protein